MKKRSDFARALGRRTSFPLLLSPILLALTSCSGDGAGESSTARADDPKSAPRAASTYALHIQVNGPSGPRRVDLPPVPLLSPSGEREKSATTAWPVGIAGIRPSVEPAPAPLAGPKFGASTTTGAVETPGGMVKVGQDLSGPSGWTLLVGAAAECGVLRPGVDGPPIINGAPRNYFLPSKATVPPWGPVPSFGDSIFIFDPAQLVDSCDKLLAYQEASVCIAQKLAEVADAVAPVTWALAPEGFPLDPVLNSGPWTIPPQSYQDRFIARDLAIYSLANAALIDLIRAPYLYLGATGQPQGWVPSVNPPGSDPSPTVPTAVCTDIYARAAANPQYAASSKSLIFGDSFEAAHQYFPPIYTWLNPGQTPSDEMLQDSARARLRFKADVLRAGGRLLKELIDSSVRDDMAGAVQLRNHASDPLRGSQLAWGEPDATGASYNSLAHAVRVLGGRWELSPSTPVTGFGGPDKMCSGVAANGLLQGAFGSTLDARIEARTPVTMGDRSAFEIIQAAGIVVPPSALLDENFGGPDGTRAAVTEQIVHAAAKKRGYEPDASGGGAGAGGAGGAGGTAGAGSSGLQFSDFMSKEGEGPALAAIIERMSDAELRAALADNFNTYRLVTQAPKDVTLATMQNGRAGVVTTGAYQSPKMQAVGIAVPEKLRRQEATPRAIPRAGGIQEASQCEEPWGYYATWNVDFGWRFAFQDSFALAQTLQQRLLAIRDDWDIYSITAPEGEPAAKPVAESAVAELDSWAGPGRLVAAATKDEEGRVDAIAVAAYGFSPEDWAVDEVSLMRRELVLVYGEPWVAECAARLRTACPPNFESEYVAHSVDDDAADLTIDIATRRRMGADRNYVGLVFKRGTPSHFQLGFHEDTLHDKHLYAVLLHDPAAPGARGKVLGALTLRADVVSDPRNLNYTLPSATTLVVSNHQQKLYEAVLGINKAWSDGPTKLGVVGPADPGGYCLPDVPYEIFVPLENELTSDSDQYENSWRHYLNLAKQAAERADTLGKDLINAGLQSDLRREAAMEEVGKICGFTPSSNEVSTKNGETVPTKPGEKGSAPGASQAVKGCIASDSKDIVFLAQEPAELVNASDNDATQFIKNSVLGCSLNGSHPLCSRSVISHGSLGLVAKKADVDKKFSCGDLGLAVQSLKTGLWGSTIQSATSRPFLQSDEIKKTLQATHITTLSDGNWRLSVANTPMLDSTPDSGLWPGCRRSSKSCGEAINGFARTMDAAFRRSVDVNADTPLGAADGNENQEVAAIRWRIEGALWSLAGLTGHAPPGLFRPLLPAANWGVITDDAATVPLPAIYGGAAFQGNPPRLAAADVDGVSEPEENQKTIGNAFDIPSSWPNLPVGEAPEVLRHLYAEAASAPGSYLHVSAESAESTGTATENPAAWVSSMAGLLGGIKCQEAGAVKVTGAPASASDDYQNALAQLVAARWAALNKGANPAQAVLNPPMPSDLYEQSCLVPHGSDLPDLWFADTFFGVGKKVGDQTIARCVPLETGPDAQQSWGFLADIFMDPADVSSYGVLPADDSCRSASFGLNPPRPGPFPLIKRSCARNRGIGGTTNKGTPAARYTARFLWPISWSPAERAPLFVNSYPPAGACGAAANFAQTVFLACMLNNTNISPSYLGPPPQLQTEEDVAQLESYIYTLGLEADGALGRLYLENVPQAVIDSFTAHEAGGAGSGLQGTTISQIHEALFPIRDGWAQVAASLQGIGRSIRSTRLQISATKLAANQAVLNSEMSRLGVLSARSSTIASVASACGVSATVGPGGGASFNLAACIGASVNLLKQEEIYGKEMSIISELKSVAEDSEKVQVLQALTSLEGQTAAEVKAIQSSLSAIESSAVKVDELAGTLRDLENQAKYQMMKGSMEPFSAGPDGTVIAYPVNSVLNYEYNITKKRYEAALREARYLAYVARRAIEQRLGLRLNSIEKPVGPFEAPNVWADDVCKMTGIDYASIRTYADSQDLGGAGGAGGTGGSSGASGAAGSSSSAEDRWYDPFIGDYVDKLEKFVEFYNMDYPSHDADDVAVLSLRDDLLPASSSCIKESPNFLLFSSHLDQVKLGTDGSSNVLGWQQHPCDASNSYCLHVSFGDGIQDVALLPPPSPGGTSSIIYSWLHDELPQASSGMAGAPSFPKDPKPSEPVGTPLRSVEQVVHLSPGKYVLSWWDQARASTGAPLSQGASTPPAYRAAVYGEGWSQMGEFVGTPTWNGVSASWSDRRTIVFDVSAEGDYHVLFQAAAKESEAGSLLVAGAQLEAVGVGGGAGPYFDNLATREMVSAGCPSAQSAAQFQALFTHFCDVDEGCYYQLNSDSFKIDTSTVRDVTSRLHGRLASGNFNYRHITVALNLVGTGLQDCSQVKNQSCYGNGYVEYTLEHDAFSAPILNWDGTTQEFPFGTALIKHGKGLAAEKYITNPIGSADQGLLSQPAYTKPELRGRPLDGTYRLKIWDQPGLQWNHLEDIQLILTYRYWSPIKKQ